MRIEYIHHSGFTVETDNYFLVFDYYKGNINLKDKKIIVFSSHNHSDHFNPEIFNWSENHPDIHYVLSNDIETKPNPNTHIMEPYEKLKLFDVNIKSYGSTDLGLSFLVEVDDKNIFFAGDLNWWYWDDDSKEEKDEMKRAFKDEIGKIKGNSIDIAFFPVDPRLREHYHLGGEYFIQELKPKLFIPMHFWRKYKTTTKFAQYIDVPDTKVVEMHKENEIIEI